MRLAGGFVLITGDHPFPSDAGDLVRQRHSAVAQVAQPDRAPLQQAQERRDSI